LSQIISSLKPQQQSVLAGLLGTAIGDAVGLPFELRGNKLRCGHVKGAGQIFAVCGFDCDAAYGALSVPEMFGFDRA